MEPPAVVGRLLAGGGIYFAQHALAKVLGGDSHPSRSGRRAPFDGSAGEYRGVCGGVVDICPQRTSGTLGKPPVVVAAGTGERISV